MNQKYRLFARNAEGRQIKEMFEAPDDTAALGKIREICRRRSITLDPVRDKLVRIVRKGIETEPVPLAA